MIDGMVFAAGLGTRLRPITDEVPKALVRVGGTSVLERAVRRLAAAGATRIVVNVHHHAEQVRAEVRRLGEELGPASCELLLSEEPGRPLETGGGLRNAAGLFRGDRPVLLHNGDVITGIDLPPLVEELSGRLPAGPAALAVLAVQERAASRRLLFDETGLCGRLHARDGRREIARPPRGAVVALAFSGVHAIAPGLLTRLPGEPRAFSIVDLYLRLASEGEIILPHDIGGAPWWEIGTPERLAEARAALGS